MTQQSDEEKNENTNVIDEKLLTLKNKNGITGIVYHDKMLLHEWPEGPDMHPEQPKRISSIYNMIDKLGLMDHVKYLVKSREITNKELNTTHPQHHINSILNYKEDHAGDYFINKHTPLAAKLSAGSVVQMMELMANNYIINGLCIIRPPGHHCTDTRPSGFCVFNNVAVGINVIRKKYPKYKKFCIVDWDVHHGNGTEALFINDPNVLYMSTHRGYGFYPLTGESKRVGKAEGKGYNINVNMKGKMGSPEYNQVFEKILFPIIKEYKPDMIIVSAGFDACIADPLGGMNILPHSYGLWTQKLNQINKNVLIVLEGGYNLTSMPAAVSTCVYSLINANTNNFVFDVDKFENFIKNKKEYNRWKQLWEYKLLQQIEEAYQQRLKGINKKSSLTYKVDSYIKNLENNQKNIKRCINIFSNYWKCFSEKENTSDKVDQLIDDMQNIKI